MAPARLATHGQTGEIRKMDSKRTVNLDWNRLLGFDQVSDERAPHSGRIGNKVGDKGGPIGPPIDGIGRD
jgi:hypothetical protein